MTLAVTVVLLLASVTVQDISAHSAPDLQVHHAGRHSAQPFLVRDYLTEATGLRGAICAIPPRSGTADLLALALGQVGVPLPLRHVPAGDSAGGLDCRLGPRVPDRDLPVQRGDEHL